jgi:DNA-3-methyladenine glycosylase II
MHPARTINPTPPFDFALSAHIFADEDSQIALYDGKRYRQVVRVDEKLMLVTVASVGSTERPKLRVTFASDRSLTNHEVDVASAIISHVFNADLDLRPFYLATGDDPILSGLTKKLRGLKNPVTSTVFDALFDSIVEQRISLNVAQMLQRPVIKAFGDVLLLNGERFYAFPTPEQLGLAPRDSLRRCGLSKRKADYIIGIAQRLSAQEVDFEELHRHVDLREVLARLCALRGVGTWTAELTALRGLNRLDAMPADDLGLRRWISHYYYSDRRITSVEARNIAERWGNWKGLASYYLIVAGLREVLR